MNDADCTTLRFIARNGAQTADDVRRAFRLTLACALDRLERLIALGYVERHRIGECSPVYVVTERGRAALKEAA